MRSSALGLLCLIFFLALIQCCREKDRLEEELQDCQQASGDEGGSAPANLIIENSDAGEWIDFSNAFTFDPTDPDDECTGDQLVYRPGVLFQFGNYRVKSAYAYDHISIYETSGAVTTYGDWVWIDIVSEYPDHRDPPIEPDEALGLYPNEGLPSTHCEIDTADWCLRSRLISGFMNDVKALMTYWQGEQGYGIAAVQTKDVCSGNEFRFAFNNKFRVDVYQPSDPFTTTSMGTPTTFALGTVDSIKVFVNTTGTTKNETQPPPWPYP